MTRLMLMTTLAVALCFAQWSVAQSPSQDDSKEKRDELKIAVQGICPISGNALGEHGDPLKVKIGEEHIFVCCKGCLQGKVDAKHWQTIHTNFAKAQAKCPVMDKALPKQPKWTVVDGQIVYICCPPCTDKIQADPEKYLALVDASYESFLEEQE